MITRCSRAIFCIAYPYSGWQGLLEMFTSPLSCKLQCTCYRSMYPVGTKYYLNLNRDRNYETVCQSSEWRTGWNPTDDENCNSKCNNQRLGFWILLKSHFNARLQYKANILNSTWFGGIKTAFFLSCCCHLPKWNRMSRMSKSGVAGGVWLVALKFQQLDRGWIIPNLQTYKMRNAISYTCFAN